MVYMPEDRSDIVDMVIDLLNLAKKNLSRGKFSDYNQNIFTAKQGLELITKELTEAVTKC